MTSRSKSVSPSIPLMSRVQNSVFSNAGLFTRQTPFHLQTSKIPDHYSYFAIAFPNKANFSLSSLKSSPLVFTKEYGPRHVGDYQSTVLLRNPAYTTGLRPCQIFEKLRNETPEILGKVRVISGDASLPNLGMNEDDKHLLLEEVSIVFHCAAVVSFKKPLECNILTGTQSHSTGLHDMQKPFSSSLEKGRSL
ncbi:hypothetical protein AVEN_262934-1 [Araneus ventricosus]|uniref:Thioester reductase (TE) domain-containing protein n=1 Tax=Araneus ventricosus TaxID=182803 RepID=A0A4Y2DIC1_ARAVE|nr:hypothetical protein AVEN_262934-1 [Araneus ventricosus]